MRHNLALVQSNIQQLRAVTNTIAMVPMPELKRATTKENLIRLKKLAEEIRGFVTDDKKRS